MNTTDISNNTAAPSVTIAPCNPAKGVFLFVVTLTTHQDVRAYPCRSREKALELASRFVAGVISASMSPRRRRSFAHPFIRAGFRPWLGSLPVAFHLAVSHLRQLPHDHRPASVGFAPHLGGRLAPPIFWHASPNVSDREGAHTGAGLATWNVRFGVVGRNDSNVGV